MEHPELVMKFLTALGAPLSIRSPHFGVGRRGSPRFVPICSNFPVFFRFVPICAPCFRECPDLFRFAPISSDLFRFVFRANQNKSGKPLSADPFCKSPMSIRTTFSTALGAPPSRTWRKKFPLEELRGGCLAMWVPKWESTQNRH